METVNGAISAHLGTDKTFQRDALASNEPMLLDCTPSANV